MSKVLSAVIVLALLAGGVYFFAPGLWTKIASVYDAQLGWGSEERRAQDPVGYLEFAQGKLEDNLKRVDTIIRDLHNHRSDLENLQGELGRNDIAYAALLDEARALYKDAEASEGSYPVEFRKAAYTRDEFLTQIEIIFNQHELTGSRLTQIEKGLEDIHQYVSNMHTERAKGQGALEDIRTAIVIAKAQMATQEVRQIMATVNDTVLALDQTVSSYERDGIAIRSADDLIASTDRADTTASRQDLLNFLEGEG